jgi:hypothetical protein
MAALAIGVAIRHTAELYRQEPLKQEPVKLEPLK